MADERRAHRAQHAWMDLRRTRAEEQARGRRELAARPVIGGALYTTVIERTNARMLAARLVRALRAIVGADGVIDRPEALLVYECDGYTLERACRSRRAAALAGEVARVLRSCCAATSPSCRAAPGRALGGHAAARRAGDDLHEPHAAHRAIDSRTAASSSRRAS
jgi:hypothetical protein